MKRTFKILLLVLVFIMCFGVVSAFAKGKTLSNDKFYAEIPENFEINDTYGDDHYFLEDVVDYSDEFEIFVEANIIFPDGIKNTDIDIIKDRFAKFYHIEESTELEIKRQKKVILMALLPVIFMVSEMMGFQKSSYTLIF